MPCRPWRKAAWNRCWNRSAPPRKPSGRCIRAAAWCDLPENRGELVSILSRETYVGAPAAIIGQAIDETGLIFHARDAGFPWKSQAAWFLSQMLRWGQIDPAADITACADHVYRPDLYRHAARALGIAALQSEKPEAGA